MSFVLKNTKPYIVKTYFEKIASRSPYILKKGKKLTFAITFFREEIFANGLRISNLTQN